MLIASHTLSTEEEASVTAQNARDNVGVTPGTELSVQQYADGLCRSLFARRAQDELARDVDKVAEAYKAIDPAEREKMKAAFPEGKKPQGNDEATFDDRR